jgi:hypothetical protein
MGRNHFTTENQMSGIATKGVLYTQHTDLAKRHKAITCKTKKASTKTTNHRRSSSSHHQFCGWDVITFPLLLLEPGMISIVWVMTPLLDVK